MFVSCQYLNVNLNGRGLKKSVQKLEISLLVKISAAGKNVHFSIFEDVKKLLAFERLWSGFIPPIGNYRVSEFTLLYLDSHSGQK